MHVKVLFFNAQPPKVCEEVVVGALNEARSLEAESFGETTVEDNGPARNVYVYVEVEDTQSGESGSVSERLSENIPDDINHNISVVG